MKLPLLLLSLCMAITATAHVSPPANDDFANAKVLTGKSGHLVLDTTEATEEPDEFPFFPLGSKTVWFRVTIPAGQTLIVDTFGSDFNTYLEAGAATSLTDFSGYYGNDDAEGTVQSRLTVFPASSTIPEILYLRAMGPTGEAGTLHFNYRLLDTAVFNLSYGGSVAREGVVAEIGIERSGNLKVAASVQVALQDDTATGGQDYLGLPVTVYFAKGEVFKSARVPIYSDGVQEGPERVTIDLANPTANAVLGDSSTTQTLRIDDADDDPANDSFANAEVLDGLEGSVIGDTTGAGTEPGEVRNDDGFYTYRGDQTVWYCWTPAASGLAVVELSGFYVGHRLTAAKGDTLPGLTSARSSVGFSYPSRVLIDAIAGETYWISVSMPLEYDAAFILEYKLHPGGGIEVVSDQTFREDAGTATVTVRRTGGAEGSVTVDYETRPLTGEKGADPATDFTATSGTLTFADGVTERTFTIALSPDTVAEGTETIRVRLSNVTGGTFLLSGEGDIYIDEEEDDPANDLFSNATVLTGAEGSIAGDNTGAGSEAADPRDGRESVWYSWVAPASGFARFRAGYDAYIQVRTGTSIVDSVVLPLAPYEPGYFPVTAGQTVHIAVYTVPGYAAASPFTLQWQLTTGSLFHFTTGTYTAAEESGHATIRIERDGSAAKAASVQFVSQSYYTDSYATPSIDYKDTSLKVSFAPGQTSKDIRIPIYPDTGIEGDEFIIIELTDPSTGSALGEAFAYLAILDYTAPLTRKATFTGLVSSPTGALGGSGYFTATTDAKGMVSGKLLLGGKAFSFKGPVAADGTAHILIPRRGKPLPTPMVLDLQLGEDFEPLAGTLTVDGIVLDVGANRAAFSKADPAILAGRYTAVLESGGNSSAPDAPGFALITVTPATGAVKMTGALADGTKFTWGTFLAPDGTIPVSILLYKSTGILHGELQLGDYTPEQDGGGSLHWVHPLQTKGQFSSAFDSDLAVRISAYDFTKGTRVLSLPDPGDADLDLSDTAGGVLLFKNIRIDDKNVVAVIAPSTNAEKIAVKIAPATGLLSGSFRHTDGKVVPFSGVLYQRTVEGHGFFLGPTVNGSVRIAE